jgi:hypothetical protein
MSHNPVGVHGLQQGYLCLFFLPIKSLMLYQENTRQSKSVLVKIKHRNLYIHCAGFDRIRAVTENYFLLGWLNGFLRSLTTLRHISEDNLYNNFFLLGDGFNT